MYPSRGGGGTGRGRPVGGPDDRAGLPDSAGVAGWRSAGVAVARARGSGLRSRPAPGSRTRRCRTPRRIPRRGTPAVATPRRWPSRPHAGRVSTAGCRRGVTGGGTAERRGRTSEDPRRGQRARPRRRRSACHGVTSGLDRDPAGYLDPVPPRRPPAALPPPPAPDLLGCPLPRPPRPRPKSGTRSRTAGHPPSHSVTRPPSGGPTSRPPPTGRPCLSVRRTHQGAASRWSRARPTVRSAVRPGRPRCTGRNVVRNGCQC